MNHENQKNYLKISILSAIAICFILFSFYILSKWKQKKEWEAYKTNIELKKAEEITIRLIEGWSNKEIGDYLEKQGIINASDFKKAIIGFNLDGFPKIPLNAKGNLQGFLYPDTYRLFKSIKDQTITPTQIAGNTIITKLLSTFESKLPKNAESLAKMQGISLYEAIILASIVENETGRNANTELAKAGLDKERKIVAGIFYNRLRTKMPLQSDATINFISGKNDPAPSLKDLEIESPYNTYKNRGLPPTPISNPSLSSISAVLNPSNTDFFYFLHKQPSGEPVYSKTFDEHIKNKLKYLK